MVVVSGAVVPGVVGGGVFAPEVVLACVLVVEVTAKEAALVEEARVVARADALVEVVSTDALVSLVDMLTADVVNAVLVVDDAYVENEEEVAIESEAALVVDISAAAVVVLSSAAVEVVVAHEGMLAGLGSAVTSQLIVSLYA